MKTLPSLSAVCLLGWSLLASAQTVPTAPASTAPATPPGGMLIPVETIPVVIGNLRSPQRTRLPDSNSTGGMPYVPPADIAKVDEAVRMLQDALAKAGPTPGTPAAPGTQVPLTAAQSGTYLAALQIAQQGRFVALGTITSNDFPNVQVSIQSISESRNSSVSGRSTTLSVSFNGDGLPLVSTVRQVTVTKAVDDQDRVYPAGRSGVTNSSPSPLLFSLGLGARVTIHATTQLGTAPRTATAFKLLEGTFDLIAPTEANGGIIRLPGIKFHRGRLEHPDLAKRGIVVVFATDRETYDEATNLRAALFRGPVSGVPVIPDGKKNFSIYYQDPSGTTMEAALLDGRGIPLTTRNVAGTSYGTNWALLNLALDSGLPDDAQLAIYIAAPEAIKKIPFRFENVPLP